MSSDTITSYIVILYLFSECNFHLFPYWSSSDTLLSSDWVLGPALSNAVCTYEIGYWAQPFPTQFEHMGSIGPHNYSQLVFIPIYCSCKKFNFSFSNNTQFFSSLVVFFFFLVLKYNHYCEYFYCFC